MKKLALISATLVGATALLTSNIALAGQDSGFYAGLGAGYGDTNYKGSDVWPDDLPQANASKADNGAVGGHLFMGYKINPYIATELGIYGFNKTEFKYNGNSSEGITNIKGDAYRGSAAFTINPTFPILNDLDVYGKVGYALSYQVSDVKYESIPDDQTSNEHASGANWTYGAGLRYYFTDHFAVSTEWDHFNKVDDSSKGNIPELDYYGVNLSMHV